MSIQIKHLLFISLAITVTVVYAFSPADHYLIDCGTTATATTVDIDHRIFNGDGSSLLLSSTKSANGYVLLHNYSVSKGNHRIKDFMISVDDDELVIRFIPVDKSSFAFVNRIEVISAPKDLIAAEYVKHAYETIYRVSVGGVKVTPFNDSLWRNWIPDDEFLKSSDDSLKSYRKIHFDGRIQYMLGGASREVGPDNMYNSARIISSLNDSIPKLNMTWVFPVKNGFSYRVRLHLCDIASISIGMMYFNVYVNGDLVYENLDLSAVTNYMLASPFYADFVVDAEKLSDIIRVDIGPSHYI